MSFTISLHYKKGSRRRLQCVLYTCHICRAHARTTPSWFYGFIWEPRKSMLPIIMILWLYLGTEEKHATNQRHVYISRLSRVGCQAANNVQVKKRRMCFLSVFKFKMLFTVAYIVVISVIVHSYVTKLFSFLWLMLWFLNWKMDGCKRLSGAENHKIVDENIRCNKKKLLSWIFFFNHYTCREDFFKI